MGLYSSAIIPLTYIFSMQLHHFKNSHLIWLDFCSLFWAYLLEPLFTTFQWYLTGWMMMNCFCRMADRRKVSKILTIGNLRHAASRIWTCLESEFRLCWTKLYSSDDHHKMVPLWLDETFRDRKWKIWEYGFQIIL